jgi:hypothetical protein
MCGISAKPSKSEKDYQAEEDHRTLTRAEEIRADKARMTRVAAHHAKTSRALKRMDRVVGGKRSPARSRRA